MAEAKAARKPAKRKGRGPLVAPAPLPDMITHLEFAERLNVSSQVFRRWVNAGKAPRPHQAIGTLWFYNREKVRRYLDGERWPG